MISREQVADLQPGDVVEVTNDKYPGLTMRGPLRPDPESRRRLFLGATVIRCDDGSPLYRDWDLTLVSRAPRPLYTNSDRTEHVAGDVVRNDEDLDDRRTWMFRAHTDAPEWTTHVGRDGPCNVIETHQRRQSLPRRLRLLVDGETGQVVP